MVGLFIALKKRNRVIGLCILCFCLKVEDKDCMIPSQKQDIFEYFFFLDEDVTILIFEIELA